MAFRIPQYLRNGVEAFAEKKAMTMSDALRFIIEDYLKENQKENDILKEIKSLKDVFNQTANGAASGRGAELNAAIVEDLDWLKKNAQLLKSVLVIIGSSNPRSKAMLMEAFPSFFKE